jgi:small RNA 2'-O-methyltransferase
MDGGRMPLAQPSGARSAGEQRQIPFQRLRSNVARCQPTAYLLTPPRVGSGRVSGYGIGPSHIRTTDLLVSRGPALQVDPTCCSGDLSTSEMFGAAVRRRLACRPRTVRQLQPVQRARIRNPSAGAIRVIRDRQRNRRRREQHDVLRELYASPLPERDDVSAPLHEERLDAVVAKLLESGAVAVLDLGCGSGPLLRRLVAEKQFATVLGVDASAEALLRAERFLEAEHSESGCDWRLHHGSFAEPEDSWVHFDAAAMVETIEHVPPEQLSLVERSVFAVTRPGTVVMTTPNREYNRLYGLGEGELRHADHKFEWSRAKFRAWASGVAERNGYEASFEDIGLADPLLGSPTQMAVFRLRDIG